MFPHLPAIASMLWVLKFKSFIVNSVCCFLVAGCVSCLFSDRRRDKRRRRRRRLRGNGSAASGTETDTSVSNYRGRYSAPPSRAGSVMRSTSYNSGMLKCDDPSAATSPTSTSVHNNHHSQSPPPQSPQQMPQQMGSSRSSHASNNGMLAINKETVSVKNEPESPPKQQREPRKQPRQQQSGSESETKTIKSKSNNSASAVNSASSGSKSKEQLVNGEQWIFGNPPPSPPPWPVERIGLWPGTACRQGRPNHIGNFSTDRQQTHRCMMDAAAAAPIIIKKKNSL